MKRVRRKEKQLGIGRSLVCRLYEPGSQILKRCQIMLMPVEEFLFLSDESYEVSLEIMLESE